MILSMTTSLYHNSKPAKTHININPFPSFPLFYYLCQHCHIVHQTCSFCHDFKFPLLNMFVKMPYHLLIFVLSLFILDLPFTLFHSYPQTFLCSPVSHASNLILTYSQRPRDSLLSHLSSNSYIFSLIYSYPEKTISSLPSTLNLPLQLLQLLPHIKQRLILQNHPFSIRLPLIYIPNYRTK